MANKVGEKKWSKLPLLGGIVLGGVFTVALVLASGFMVETTNTDQFCISCHEMKPFQKAWTNSVHGGQNPQGFAAQCVDCHLPHGNFLEYLTTKAITGTGDVIAHFTVDVKNFDWAANTKINRPHFTFDSACLHCHHNLTPPGLSSGGFIAHRAYLRGEANRMCSECHPHVGHKDMLGTADEFFKKM